jgi:hypothetical protein
MLVPNITTMFKWVNTFFSGVKNQSQDYLQIARASDGTVIGWIDETGTPRGSLTVPAVTPPDFIGDSGSGGVAGLVPAPPAGSAAENEFLSADGSFAPTPSVGASFFSNLPPGTIVSPVIIADNEGGFCGGSGRIGGFAFFLPAQIATSGIIVTVGTADSTNEYDIGIYGPLTASLPFTYPSPTFVNATLPLVCHTGPTKYTSATTPAGTPWTSPFILEAGLYVMLFTTAGSTGLDLTLHGINESGEEALISPYVTVDVETDSTGSTLPNTVNTFVYSTAVSSGGSLLIQFGLF